MPVLGKIAEAITAARTQQALPMQDAALFGRDGYRAGPPSRISPKADRICGAPGCTGGWTMPWKSRSRPVFEQEWGCSERCLTSLVHAAVRREAVDGDVKPDQPHRHRVPLGLVLLAQGWISHPQLTSALDAQRATGRGRIGDWLSQSCGLAEERIARGLGVQWSCPVLNLDGFSARTMALTMPKRLVAECGMVPVRLAGSTMLYLAFEERPNASVALGVEQMCGLKVESGLLAGSQFETARSAVLAADGIPVQMKLVTGRDGLTAGIVRLLEQKQPVAARLVRIHQYYWLRMWLDSGATKGIGGLPPGPEDMADALFLVGGNR